MNSKLGGRRSKPAPAIPKTHQEELLEEEPKSAQPWWRSMEKWTGVSTVVMGIFTVVLAVVSIYQYRVAARTDATQRVIERAFVLPKSIEVEGMQKRAPDGTMLWQITTLWENTGNTATQDLVIYTMYRAHNGPAGSGPPFPPADPKRKPQPGDITLTQRRFPAVDFATAKLPNSTHRTLLGPHQVRLADQMVMNAAGMQRLENRAANLAVAGVALYKDQFGKKHITMFCQNLVVPSIDYFQSEANRVYETKNPDCPEYNCQDEDCQRYKALSWLPPESLPW